MAFPSSPVNNQTAVVNGITYVYNSTNQTWTRQTLALGGTTVTINTIPPASGSTPGDRWIDSNDYTQYIYTYDGNSYQWVDFSTPTVNVYSILGGSGGAIPYQIAASNTSFVTAGITGQVLTINGLTPTWSNPSSLNFGTDSILISKGTTAQRPSGVSGYLRFNTDTNYFEGYNGTSWITLGTTVSNDSTTASYLYPLFSTSTSGLLTATKTNNSNLLYKPSTGDLQANTFTALNGVILNNQSITSNVSIPTGYNAQSTGPVTVSSGFSVTVSSGSRWVIL